VLDLVQTEVALGKFSVLPDIPIDAIRVVHELEATWVLHRTRKCIIVPMIDDSDSDSEEVLQFTYG